MKRLHLFFFLSCLILVIVYFGLVKSTHEPYAQCNAECVTKYNADAVHWNALGGVDSGGSIGECPSECPICIYTPPSGGPPENLNNNNSRFSIHQANNADNKKKGKCIPPNLNPTGLTDFATLNPSETVNMVQLEMAIAAITVERFFTPRTTLLPGPGEGFGNFNQRLQDIHFLGYYLLLTQGLNLQQPTQLLTDTGPYLTVTEDGIPEGNPNPPLTIPNILQTQQANLNPNQQVAVNFPDVLGNTLMLPMIPILPLGDPRFNVNAMFDRPPDGINDPLLQLYTTQIRPAIIALVQMLTPENHPTIVELPNRQLHLTFATGMNQRLGAGSPVNQLSPDLVQMIGDYLRPMPNLLTDQQGIFRVNFNINEQTTDLQTVLGQALYNSDNPTLTNEQWHLVLWIAKKFAELQQFCTRNTRTRMSATATATRSPQVDLRMLTM